MLILVSILVYIACPQTTPDHSRPLPSGLGTRLAHKMKSTVGKKKKTLRTKINIVSSLIQFLQGISNFHYSA